MSVADGLDRWATAHARTVGGTIGAAPSPAERGTALDLGTFRQVGSVPCGDTRMHGFAITTTADGRVLLATCDDDHSITVHDLTGAGDRVVLRGHGARINALAWLEPSDGHERLVSGDTQGGVWLWDAEGGPSRQLPVTEARAVRAVAWTRMPGGGTRLALSRVDAIEVWDPDDPDGATCIGIAPGHRESTWAVRWFRRRGDAVPTLVTGGYDGTVRTWRPDLDELAVVPCIDGGVGDVVLAEGADAAMWAVVTCFTSIDVWDLTAGRHVRTLADDAGGAQAVAALRLPDDRLVAVTNGDEGVARVWDVETGEVVAALEHPAEIRDSVGFAVLPDGRLLLAAACDNDEAYLWETDPPVAGRATGERLAPLTELSFTLDREFHHGGHTLNACLGRIHGRPVVATTGLDGQVKVWDVGSGERRYTLDDHGAPTYAAAAIQHEGEMLLATGAEGSGDIRIWDVTTGTFRGALEGPASEIGDLAWTHDENGTALLAGVGNDWVVRVWDGLGSATHSFDAGVPYRATWIAAPGRPVRLATSAASGDIRIWDLASGRQVGGVADRRGLWKMSAGHRADGAPLLAVSHGPDDDDTTIWDVDAGTVVSSIGDRQVLGLAWYTLPDGRLLLFTSGRGRALRVWEPETGTCLATLAHATYVRHVTVDGSGDRLLVATACDDGFARVWSTDLARFRRPPRPVVAEVAPSASVPGRRPVSVAEAVLLGAGGGWHPLGLTSDLVNLTGPEGGPAPFDPRLAPLAQHPGVARLRGLRWPRPARAAFAALLSSSQAVQPRYTPPPGSSAAAQLRVLRRAAERPSDDPTPAPVDVAALQAAADRITPGVVTLLRVLGPKVAADDPMLPVRLLHRAPDLPELTSAQHSVLAASAARISRRRAVGTSTMRAAGTAGVTRRGAPTSLLLTELALPDDVFDARYAAEQLLHRHHPAGTTPRPGPVTIVLDTTPPTFGPAEGLLRLLAHLMTQVLWDRGARPRLVTLAAPDRARELMIPADLMDVWTSRTLAPPDLAVALDTAARSSTDPTVTLTVHHHAPLHPLPGPQHRLVTTHQPGWVPRRPVTGPDHHHLPPDPAPSVTAAVLTAVLSSEPR